MSTKKINYAIIQKDECGKDCMFRIPLAALSYGTGVVSCFDEMRIDAHKEKLFCMQYSDDDVIEQMIFTVDDKVDYVRWVKKVCGKVQKVIA